MAYTINRAKQAVLNKWDWTNPENNIPIFIWGPLGIGKTQLVSQIVSERMIYELSKIQNKSEKDIINLRRLKEFKNVKHIEDLLDEHLLVLRLAERPIEQLQGIPAPDFNNKRAVFLMPENVAQFSQKAWVVVFIDELDKADESKMAAATHLIESRRIGDFILPKDTMIIVAANRVTDSYISKTVVPELRNRAAHIEIEPDIEAWVSWAATSGVRKDIISFLLYKHKSGQNFLAIYDDQAESNSTSGFPTPRTWHMASMQLDRLQNIISYDELIQELSEFVGTRAANEYKIYNDLYSRVNIMDILTGAKRIPKFMQGPNNKSVLSDQYIYVFAMMDQLTVDHLSNDNYINNLLIMVEDLMPDLRAIFMKFLFSNDDLIKKITSVERGNKVISQHLEKMGRIIK